MNKSISAYAQAGVNIDVKTKALNRVRRMIHGTMTRNVMGDWGLFGGLFKSPGKNMVLVSSIDGVGTKLKVAERAGRHDTVGQDLVNHCVNDILAQGAEPLFFLDYIGTSKLEPHVFEQLISGLCKACKENGCVLIGGETAEMPGLYPEDEYDLVGAIVGAVDHGRMITGQTIKAGDVLIGLPSSGLHTNGYSLARAVIFRKAQLEVNDIFPGTRKTVADVLLAVHKSYLKPIRSLMQKVKIQGLAHITGGGFIDNLPRIFPRQLSAVIDCSAWKMPPLFKFLRDAGQIDAEEMYRVFNMGIGMVAIVRPRDATQAVETLRAAGEKPYIIGRMEKGKNAVKLKNYA